MYYKATMWVKTYFLSGVLNHCYQVLGAQVILCMIEETGTEVFRHLAINSKLSIIKTENHLN